MRMNQAKFAKHIGRSRQWVNKLVKAGVLTLHDGKLDIEEAKQAIKDHEDPRKEGVRRSNEEKRDKTIFDAAGEYPAVADLSEAELEKRSREEKLKILKAKRDEAERLSEKKDTSELTKLDSKELARQILVEELRIKKAKADNEEGLLVSKEEISRELADAAIIFRDNLKIVGDRLGARTASSNDPHTNTVMIHDELTRYLDDMILKFEKYA